MTRPNPLHGLLRLGAFAALGLALVIGPVYAVVAAGAGTYQQIVPVDEALVDVNRFTYAEDPSGKPEDVVAIYGTPKGEPTAYVFVDESRIVRPDEDASLALLIAPEEGQPTQLALVRFVALRLALGALATSLVLFGLGVVLRRRQARGQLEAVAA